MEKNIYIIGGKRTPFIPVGNKPNPLSKEDLAVFVAQTLLIKQNIAIDNLGEVIIGTVSNNFNQHDVGRVIALRLGRLEKVIGRTVSCDNASGLMALDCACKDIELGKHELILAGGVEAMSHRPLCYGDNFVNLLEDLNSVDSFGNKVKTIFTAVPRFFYPITNFFAKFITKISKNANTNEKIDEEDAEKYDKCLKYNTCSYSRHNDYNDDVAEYNLESRKFNKFSKVEKTKKSYTSKKYIISKKQIKAFTSFARIRALNKILDPVSGMNMGQIAEEVAYKYKISREEMDGFALFSHLKAIRSQKENKFINEIVPIFDWQDNVYCSDSAVNGSLSKEILLKMKPAFDKNFGDVTFGNSFCIADGACLMLLASEKIVSKYDLTPLGKIVDIVWEGVSNEEAGFACVHAISTLLKQNKLSINDINFWEIHEDFAANVLAILKAMEDTDYCKEHLGLEGSIGKIDQAKLNVDGGAIAIGNPIGATGTRLVLHLLNVLSNNNSKYGIACISSCSTQAGAILVESIKGVEDNVNV